MIPRDRARFEKNDKFAHEIRVRILQMETRVILKSFRAGHLEGVMIRVIADEYGVPSYAYAGFQRLHRAVDQMMSLTGESRNDAYLGNLDPGLFQIFEFDRCRCVEAP